MSCFRNGRNRSRKFTRDQEEDRRMMIDYYILLLPAAFKSPVIKTRSVGFRTCSAGVFEYTRGLQDPSNDIFKNY